MSEHEHQHIEPKPLSEEDKQRLAEQSKIIVPLIADGIVLNGAKISKALLPHIKKYLEEKHDEPGGDA